MTNRGKGFAVGSRDRVDDLLAAGIGHHEAGRLDEAMRSYAAVLEKRPDSPDALHYLGVIAHQRGNHSLAAELIARSLVVAPDVAETHNNLAIVLANLGRTRESGEHAARATRLAPTLAAAWNTLGTAQKAHGGHEEAAQQFRHAAALDPALAHAHNNLGNALQGLGRYDEAVVAYDRALDLNPFYDEAYGNRGNAKLMLGQIDAAIADGRRAVLLHRPVAKLWNNYAIALNAGLNLVEARAAACRAVWLAPDDAESHVTLGGLLGATSDTDGAETSYRRALALNPALPAALGNLANLLRHLGQQAEAQSLYRRALAISPGDAQLHSSLIFCMTHDPACDNEAIWAECLRWAASHAAPRYARAQPLANAAEPDRRLRIAYVSADFAEHPIAYNMIQLIERHDRAAFEVVCYAEVPSADALTNRFMKAADLWRNTVGQTDEQVVDQMRADGIDIAVAMQGHTANNRLALHACRPAPIQISYGISTSGMVTMDYWFTDAGFHPADTTERSTEQLYRLPNLAIHEPPGEAPAIAPGPLTRHGHVTFGSYNNPSKLTPDVIGTWARILAQVPESRLALKFFAWYASPALQRRLIEAFGRHGIGPGRLSFLGDARSRRDHLAAVAETDIALDPFPYNGWTTTFQALWMGVPVVALAGDRFLGRIGASFLSATGLSEFIARDTAEYVALAVDLAADRDRLAKLRATLRQRVADSPLCQPESYTRSVETAYREMWRRWCAARGEHR